MQYGTSAKSGDYLGGVPVLRMGNIVDGRIDLADLKYLPPEHEAFPALFLTEGDLLFNRTNSPELVGKTAVVRSLPQPCSFASYLIRVRFAPEVVPEFVSWFINSPLGRAWVHANLSQQVGQANLSGAKLRAMTVPLPPLGIAEYVAREVSGLLEAQRVIASTLGDAIDQAERLKRSLLVAAQRGELVTPAPGEIAGPLVASVRDEVSSMRDARHARKVRDRGAVGSGS